MSIWIIIGLILSIVYVIVAIALFVGLTKNSDRFRFSYVIVSIFWPIWLTYFVVSISIDLIRFRQTDKLL